MAAPSHPAFRDHIPGGSDGKASACNEGDPGSIPGWEDLLEKETATHSSTLAWRIPRTEESRTQLSDFTFTFPLHNTVPPSRGNLSP